MFHKSFPTWERELKLSIVQESHHRDLRRSPRGNVNWNMASRDLKDEETEVVPHVGTWIEIVIAAYPNSWRNVVPHVGTWIEIKGMKADLSGRIRRSPRGNVNWNIGEKNIQVCELCRSPRGNVNWNLLTLFLMTEFCVVPHVGTWIEISFHGCVSLTETGRSPRGNVNWNTDKPDYRRNKTCRSPRGNVNWNCIRIHRNADHVVVPHVGTWIEMLPLTLSFKRMSVVPHVGTWIEISAICSLPSVIRSFPTWERELK